MVVTPRLPIRGEVVGDGHGLGVCMCVYVYECVNEWDVGSDNSGYVRGQDFLSLKTLFIIYTHIDTHTHFRKPLSLPMCVCLCILPGGGSLDRRPCSRPQ
jgi:hypothetical protein